MKEVSRCPGCGASVKMRDSGAPYRHKRSGYRFNQAPWCDGRKLDEVE